MLMVETLIGPRCPAAERQSNTLMMKEEETEDRMDVPADTWLAASVCHLLLRQGWNVWLSRSFSGLRRSGADAWDSHTTSVRLSVCPPPLLRLSNSPSVRPSIRRERQSLYLDLSLFSLLLSIYLSSMISLSFYYLSVSVYPLSLLLFSLSVALVKNALCFLNSVCAHTHSDNYMKHAVTVDAKL